MIKGKIEAKLLLQLKTALETNDNNWKSDVAGNSIYQFLQRCLDSLRKDFHELKNITADQLMYVKEDLIIPHHYSFYDFIVTKVPSKAIS